MLCSEENLTYMTVHSAQGFLSFFHANINATLVAILCANSVLVRFMPLPLAMAAMNTLAQRRILQLFILFFK